MASFNDELADEMVARGINLMRFAEGTRREVLHVLEDLRDDLAAKIAKIDPSAPLGKATERVQRQVTLFKQVNDSISTAYADVSKLHGSQMVNLADIEAKHLVKRTNNLLKVDVMSMNLSPKQLEVIASDTLIQGAPSRDWWAKQSKDLQDSFKREVRMGVASGETNDQIVRRVRGQHTGKWITTTNKDGKAVRRGEFAGGIMQASTREATALVRTSVQAIAQETRLQVLQDNEDVIKGWQFLTTLDGRTCPRCMPYSGRTFDLRGNPLGSSPKGGDQVVASAPPRSGVPEMPHTTWVDKVQQNRADFDNRLAKNPASSAEARRAASDWDGYAAAEVNARLDAAGLGMDEAKARTTRVLQDFAENSDVAIRVPASKLGKILDEGGLKSQFETGKSSGYFDPRKRAETEFQLFGLDRELDPAQRPIYGYLAHRGEAPPTLPGQDRLLQYGEVAIRLKPAVRDRVSITVGDSTDLTGGGRSPQVAATPLLNPSHLSMKETTIPFVKKYEKNPLDMVETWSYVEAQVFGGVGVSDISSVEFLHGKTPSKAIQKKLESLGITWTVVEPDKD